MTTVNEAPATHVRQIRELPGPPGWPVLGNALDVDPSTVHLKAEQWAREFGEAYRIRIASREFVVLSNPETVAKILRDRPDGFGRTTRFSETAEELAFGGVLSSNGESWKRQRPMVLSGLDPAHLKRFFPTLSRVTQRLPRAGTRGRQAGGPIDLQADLMRYTVDVTAGLALGTDINTIESKEEIIQEHLDKILPALFKRTLAPVRYWRLFKLPYDRALERHVEALRAVVQSFITEARRRLDEEPHRKEHPTNLIEAMLVAHERERGLTEEDVSRNVLTMLLAGEDTTANTLAWMIWLLHGKPAAKSSGHGRGAGASRRRPPTGRP